MQEHLSATKKHPTSENFIRLQTAWKKVSSQEVLMPVDLENTSIDETISAMVEGMKKLNNKEDELHTAFTHETEGMETKVGIRSSNRS